MRVSILFRADPNLGPSAGFAAKSALLAIAFTILLGGLANSQIDDSTPPPLNKEGMLGAWEAITELPLPTFLLHFEFKLQEPSFLVTKSAGSPVSQVFKLVSSDITEGHAKFHFRPVLPASEQGGDIGDLWLEGIAHGGGNVSVFRARMWKNAESPPKEAGIFSLRKEPGHAISPRRPKRQRR
jgi:hypothetical protein